MSRWFLFAARGRTGSSCLAIGARPGLVVEDLDLFLKLVPDKNINRGITHLTPLTFDSVAARTVRVPVLNFERVQPDAAALAACHTRAISVNFVPYRTR